MNELLDRNMTQTELAELTGIGKSTITEIATGRIGKRGGGKKAEIEEFFGKAGKQGRA